MSKSFRGVASLAVFLIAAPAFTPSALAARRPDLVVKSLRPPPETKPQGGSFRARDTTKNRGGARAGTTKTRYLLSANRTKGRSDIRLSPVRDIPRLRAGATSRGGANVKVPRDTSEGSYFVLACADWAKKIRESNESNNCRASKTLIDITDGVAPRSPVITETDPTSPSSDLTPKVLGKAERGATVQIFKNGTCAGSPATTAQATKDGFDTAVTVVPDTKTTLSARAIDDAGNVSRCSNSYSYEHDGDRPTDPTITGFDPAPPSNVNDPKMIGTAEADTQVQVFRSARECTTGENVDSQGSAAQFASPGITVKPVPDDSRTTFYVKAIDTAGNDSACVQAAYTEDSTPPSPPEITGTDPSGISSDNDPEVFGSAAAGATVKLYKSDDCSGTYAATGTPAEFANPGLTVHVVDNSATPVTATATDRAGNDSSCSSAITYVEDSPTMGSEPNDTPETANPYTGVMAGSIHSAGDSDFFSVDVPPGGRIVAETFRPDRAPCEKATDTILWLLAPDGSRLAADGDSGAGSCSLIDATRNDSSARDLDPGTYYLRVWALDAISDYRLRVDVSGTPNEDEPNDSSAQATPMRGRWAGGDLDPGSESDFFSFHVPHNGTIAAETFDATGRGCSGMDSTLRIYRPNGVLVGENDDHSTTCSRVTHDSGLPEGVYFAAVTASGAGSPFADYSLRVETGRITPPPEAEVNDSIEDADARAPAILINGNDRYTGAISVSGDKDFYKVSLSNATVLRFETFGPSGDDCTNAIPTTVRLYDSMGAETRMDSGSGIGRCGAIVSEVPAGTSYISVERTGDAGTLPSYVLESRILGETASESEPNETAAAAGVATGTNMVVAGDHPTGGDSDFFAITVPPGGKSIRAEVIEGTDPTESCESGGIDSRLTLFDSSGLELAGDDDGGRGFCSLIDGTGSPTTRRHAGAFRLAPGTYYLQLTASCEETGPCATGPTTTFSYRLAVAIR